jgi:hypothetical protein
MDAAIIHQSPSRTRPRKWSVLQNNGWPDRANGGVFVLFLAAIFADLKSRPRLFVTGT